MERARDGRRPRQRRVLESIAVTPDGRPSVVYPQGPASQGNQPGVHRFRTAAAGHRRWWRATTTRPSPLFRGCSAIRLVSIGDGSLALFSIGADRYGANWVNRRGWDGTSWGGAGTVDYASIGSHIHDHQAAAGFSTWHLVERRSDYGSGTGQPPPGAPLPARPHRHARDHHDRLVRHAVRRRLVRPHALRVARRREPGAPLPRHDRGHAEQPGHGGGRRDGSPTPAVAADPIGDDGAFAVWLENGQLRGSTFSATAGTWSAPLLVASNAGSAPVAAAYGGVTHLAWLGTAGELRYTSLP
ncbi:MAG: hypothetical protein IPK07_24205 [Deltaproteobacteria bacterium]|nr:hypothetical protein [Deltaproteobacteria bacterium]